jgi:hypothetical protein
MLPLAAFSVSGFRESHVLGAALGRRHHFPTCRLLLAKLVQAPIKLISAALRVLKGNSGLGAPAFLEFLHSGRSETSTILLAITRFFRKSTEA